MIVGLGIDVVDVARIEAAISRWDRFVDKIFTQNESHYARASSNIVEKFAARFSAKEAAIKALRAPSGMSWHDLEIINEDDGAPKMILSGQALNVANQLAVKQIFVSMTHTKTIASAVVLIES